MFHEGDLRSGIALSLAQNKLLTCFIHDDDHAGSAAWEASLQREADLIKASTVLLRFSMSSQEKTYLSTFCPVTQAPAVVVLKFGAVIEKLEPPLTEEEMVSRLKSALIANLSTQSGDAVQAEERATAPSSTGPQSTEVPIDMPTQASRVNATQANEVLHSLLPDRAARMKADQEAKLAEEKAERVARAEERRREAEAVANAASATSSKGKQVVIDAKELGRQEVRADWIKQQAKRKEQAAKERERILQSIESDRQERRHRAISRKENAAASEPLQSLKSQTATAAVGQGCNLQVRLPGGSSIRQRFDSQDTLSDAVRAWVADSTAPDVGKLPSYTFKLIRAPQPSRNIGREEETQTLGELEMLPSATLVIIEHLSSHQADGTSLSDRLRSLFRLVLANIISFFSYILGITSSDPAPSEAVASPRHDNAASISSATRSTGIESRSGDLKSRTKTFRDTEENSVGNEDPAEFYNGNSSAFEGRKDDEDTL